MKKKIIICMLSLASLLSIFMQAQKGCVVTQPSILTIIPNKGPTTGGTLVQITGNNFDSNSKVTFDGIEGNIQTAQTTEITVLTPPHPGKAGAVEVKVINPGGQWDSEKEGFTYYFQRVTFSAKTSFTVGTNPNDLITFDTDRDADLDLVVADYTGNDITVLANDGKGVFFSRQTILITNPFGLVSFDFDIDGRPDIFASNNENNISFFKGNGDGTFTLFSNYSTNGSGVAGWLSAGKFNDDRNTDVVVPNRGSNNISVMVNSGQNSFSTISLINTQTRPVQTIVDDFNGDRKLDIVVSNSGSGTVSLLLGNGTAAFPTINNLPTGLTKPLGLVSGDFNNDGSVDLVIGNDAGNSIAVMLGKGNGTFQTPKYITVGLNPNRLSAADINQDGLLDLAVSNFSSGNISILLGFGDGNFNVGVTLDVGSTPYANVIGDFNNDTRLDIAVTSWLNNNVSVFLNSSE